MIFVPVRKYTVDYGEVNCEREREVSMNWFKDLLGLKPSPEEFAKTVLKFITASGYPELTNPRYDAEQFAIVCSNDAGVVTATLNLGNAYDEYCRVPKAMRRQLLTAFFLNRYELPETLNEAIVNLIARLQPRIFFEGMKLRSAINTLNGGEKDEASNMPHKIIGEHFGVTLVHDCPSQVSYISQATLEKWGSSFEELLPRAVTNLTRLTPEPFQPLQDGVYYSHYADTHDCSRLLVTHRVQACRLKGRPVAFTPNRNTLVLTGEDDVEGLALSLKFVQEALKEPRPLPVFALILDGEEWQLWDVPAEHPCKDDLSNQMLISMADIYGEQKALLEKKFEKEGHDVFVASLTILSDEKVKRYFSICVWSEGVPTYLPESDRVVFVESIKGKPGKVLLTATFASVLSVMGDEMKFHDMYPPRYFVEKFPTAEQLERIRALGEVK